MNFAAFLRHNAPFLAVGVLMTFCSSFGQTFFISVFAGAIRDEFALSHGTWGAIYSAGTTASAVAMVWAGLLTDHFRVRVLGAVVLVGLASASLLMAAVPAAWLLPVAIFFLRFFGQGMSGLIAMVAMARWFVATRGRALSVATLGVATGEAFLPLAFVALLGPFDWRALWVVAAIVPLALVPLLIPLLRLERTPQSAAAETQAVGMLGEQWTRVRMLRHWLFWFIVPALLAPAAFSTAFFFQQVHLAETKGWEHMGLVALFPVFTSASILSMLGSGAVIDRIGTVRLMPLYQLPMAAGFVLMSQAGTLGTAAIAMALMGLSQGANQTVPNAFWAEFYGTRYLGGIKSLAAAAMVLGTAIGPGLTGALIDKGIVFEDQMIGIAVYFVSAAVLVGTGIARARPLLSAATEVNVVRP